MAFFGSIIVLFIIVCFGWLLISPLFEIIGKKITKFFKKWGNK